MPRPTLFNNRKFMRLVSVLNMPEPHVLGHLEYMWRVAYESADALLGDSTDVELAAKWAGKRDDYTQALVQTGFLDESAGGYVIHDFWVHAPDYVQKKAEREIERQKKGLSLSELRSSAGKKGAKSRWQPIANENHLPSENGKRMANDSKLLPSSPLLSSPLLSSPSQGHTPSRSKPSEASESFLKFWDSYPHSRRTGKPQCLKVWKTKGLDSMIETILTALENHKASNDWQKEGGQYIPGSAVWLNQERWEQKMDVVTPQPIQSKSPPLVSTPGKRVVSAEDFTRETDELRVRLRAGGQ